MGGAERSALNLAGLWSGAGNDVVVMPTYSGGGVGSFYRAPSDVEIRYLADMCESVGAVVRLLTLRRFIKDEKFDVVVSFITNVNVAAVIAAVGTKVPVIVCERSDPFLIPISFFWKFARAICYPLAKCVVIQTEELRDKFLHSISTYKQKIFVIPNSIPAIFLGEKNKPSLRTRVLAVGRLSKEKQFDHLIFALSEMEINTDWVCEIFGDGEEKVNLQRLINSLNLEKQVFLRGATRNIEEIYNAGDLFCLTSQYEGFPNALLEAAASGCAVVSYATPCGAKEILQDGRYGVLIPLNDISALSVGIKKLLLDDDVRKTLGAEASSFVIKNFNSDVIMQKWNSLLYTDN